MTSGVGRHEDVGGGDGIVLDVRAAPAVVAAHDARPLRAVDLLGEDQRRRDRHRTRAAARSRLVDHVLGAVAHVQAEVERRVGRRGHAAVPGGHGDRGPEMGRFVPRDQGSGPGARARRVDATERGPRPGPGRRSSS